MQVLDQIDYKILMTLSESGRTSFSKLARGLNITDVAVKKRFENLMKKGIIKKIGVELDYRVLGIEGEILAFLKCDPFALEKNIKTLQESDFVQTAYKTVGDYNLVFMFLLKDFTQISLLDKIIAKMNAVTSSKFLIVTKKVFDKNTIPKASLQVYYR